MGVVIIDAKAVTPDYAGIGNIRLVVVGESTFRISCSPGVVGAGYRRLSPETVFFAPGDSVVLFTNGIPEKAHITEYPQSTQTNPQFMAERILREWSRVSDDAAVLVFRSGQD